MVTIEQKRDVGLIFQTIDTVRNGGVISLAGATASSSLANDTCIAVRLGEDAFDLTTTTFRAAMRASPRITPVGVHDVQWVLFGPCVCTCGCSCPCQTTAGEMMIPSKKELMNAA
jgi:hypothetical protein